MIRSQERILTTHVGSLPRNGTLTDLLIRREAGEAIDGDMLAGEMDKAVRAIVDAEVAAGIDIGNDGEQQRVGFQTYIPTRMSGFGGESRRKIGRDFAEVPELIEMFQRRFPRHSRISNAPQAIGEVRYRGESELLAEIRRFQDCLKDAPFAEAFMTAPSPGILTRFIINLHYPSEDAYVAALADVIKTEYRAIVEAGFVLQIDAPDLASARNNQYRDLSDDEFRKIAERNIEALNAATADLPADRMRLHICWGNYEGPHTHDLPLTKIIDIAFKARPQAISIEAANPRHDHEWEDLKDVDIPEDKILIPGVIDSTTNFVEHPRLVAQRIGRYAELIDRERLIAGVDCGFGTSVRRDPMVADSIVWAKLRALSEGAAIASKRLWG